MTSNSKHGGKLLKFVSFLACHVAICSELDLNVVTNALVDNADDLHEANNEITPVNEGTCSRDRCDESESDWEGYDVGADAHEIISRLSSYELLCNVDRRHVNDLTFSEFLHRYAYNQPVILQGASDNSRLRRLTTKKQLLTDYGKSLVRLSTANTHSYDKVDTTLFNYINNMMKPQSMRVKGNETFYWFGDNNYTEFASLFSAYNPPKYSLPDKTSAYSFGVAAAGTGVPFHWHGPGFAEVIHGKKMWFLSPPDQQPKFHPDLTTLHWLLNEFDHISERDVKPTICTIEPGEAIYFPDRWWHATLNTRTSVFISTFLAKI